MSKAWDRTGANKAVVHHLGDGGAAARTAAELITRANPGHPGYPNGYDYPEYDYGILFDGAIIPMRPLTVVGAHAIADRVQYMLGANWWNLNSVGVVLGIDSTLYDPPAAMVAGLIKFLTGFCRGRGVGVEALYPHYQITQTDCPGASYDKIGLTTGRLDYNYVEASVKTNLLGGVSVGEKPAVVVFGIWDLVGAYRLAGKLKCPVLLRETNWRAMGFNKFYIVGGPEEYGPDVVNITGDAWEDTTGKLLGVLK